MVLGQVRVSLYGNLRQAAGQKSVNSLISDQLSVRRFIGEVIKLIPGLEPELINDEGELYGHLNILVNGRDIRFLDGNLNYLLGDGDRVSLFPALSGGQKGIILLHWLNRESIIVYL
jgi:molybdopterin synthase sulfur carrier subunit